MQLGGVAEGREAARRRATTLNTTPRDTSLTGRYADRNHSKGSRPARGSRQRSISYKREIERERERGGKKGRGYVGENRWEKERTSSGAVYV